MRLPTSILVLIYKLCDTKDKKNFYYSEKFNKIKKDNTKVLTITLDNEDVNEEYDDNILVKLLSSYSRIESLKFRLDTCYSIYIKTLSTNLLSNPCVSKRIKYFCFNELINYVDKNKMNDEESQKITNDLFQAMSHEKLERLVIIVKYTNSSVINKNMDMILSNCINLKSFYFHVRHYNSRKEENGNSDNYIFSLKHLAKLTDVTFSHFSESLETIKSLNSCVELESLEFRTNTLSSVYDILSFGGFSFNKLKTLEASTLIDNDEELNLLASMFPKLDSLVIYLRNTATDFSKLSKLELLEFKTVNATHVSDNMINAITRCLPNLKFLDFNNAKKFTAEGFKNIANNCKELEDLRIENYSNISMEAAQSLVKNCKKIEILCLKRIDNNEAYKNEISYLNENFPNLKYKI